MFEEIKSESVIKGPPCTVGLALQKMSKAEKVDFDTACKDPSIAATIIARVVMRHGYEVKSAAIIRHRKGDCLCE